MDHHPAHQDPCVEQRPPHGDCQGADRTLQRACRRRPRVSHAQQQRVQQAPQTDSQSLRHPQGDRLPPKPPHLRHDRLSLQRRHHRGALQDTRAQAHFHDPDLRRGDQQDGKLRFPGDLRQPRRHAAERAGEEGQETGRKAGAPLPPGNGLTPSPAQNAAKAGTSDAVSLPLLHFPMHTPVRLCWTFPPFALWAHVHVVLLQHTQQIRLAVERLARQRYVRDQPLRAIVLQRSRRDVQQPAHVLAREIDLAVHRRAEVRRYRVEVPYAFLQRLEVRPYLFRVPCDHFHLTRPPSFPGSWLPRTPPRPPSGSKSCG